MSDKATDASSREQCIPFDSAADIEEMPGGWNVMVTPEMDQAVWIRRPAELGDSADTTQLLLCGSGRNWKAILRGESR